MSNDNQRSSSESMEEHFDRISDENYERIDREFVRNIRDADRRIDRLAMYEKTPRFFYGLAVACAFGLLCFFIGLVASIVFGL